LHDFCKCMSPRARPWTTETSQIAGEGNWDDCRARSKVALRPRAIAEGSQGQGSRTTVASTLPIEIARDGDFAPTPIASGRLLSRASTPVPLSGATWGGRDVAVAVHGCKVCAARGSCDARLPRRRRALTNPRGLPSRGRSLCELGGPPAPGRSLVRESRQRLFHHHPNPCEGRSRGYSMARPSPRESGEPLW
jgi:hypothetical protein